MTTYFDDSLEKLIKIIISALGATALTSGVALRDSTGQLCFFSNKKIPLKKKTTLATKILKELGSYAREDQPVADISDYGAEDILSEPSIRRIYCAGQEINFIDRRLIGADWLRSPSIQVNTPPRFVFSSIKGGVGRSTALAVVAADLASRGLKVLAVDLDIEAPGLGSILLTEETLPEFGLLDALVENGLTKLDDRFLVDLVGPSPFGGQAGKIDVIPVLGRRSLSNPADVLSKIARAYAEDYDDNGETITILDQISQLIDQFSDPKRYDVILVDARAGLHETTASALLGLGAEVLLFGLDEPQTFQGFSMLLAHMKRYISSDDLNSWLTHLTIVQGKAPTETDLRASFSESCQTLFLKIGLDSSNSAVNTKLNDELDDFEDIIWNDEISDVEVLPTEQPTYFTTIAIIDDPRYKGFNPRLKRDLVEREIYASSYKEIIDKINGSLPSLTELNHAT